MKSKYSSVFNYTNYKAPVLSHDTNYTTSTGSAHIACSSKIRNFIPYDVKNLCSGTLEGGNENPHLKRFVSEKKGNFPWKINSNRNKREELAPALIGVDYVTSHTERINTRNIIVPTNIYSKGEYKPFKKQFNDPIIPIYQPPQMNFMWKTSFNTDTDGSYKFMDPMISTTTLDFIPHQDYESARTKLIVRNNFTFNADKSPFIPNSFLLQTYPIFNKYSSNILRDFSKFPATTRDRDHLVPRRWKFVPTSFTTEMKSNY